MPEHSNEAKSGEERPHRKRRLTLIESYGAFSDDRLREVTEKIRGITLSRSHQPDPADEFPEAPSGEPIDDSIGDLIGDSIGDSIGTPIHSPIESPIDSPDRTPIESPIESPNELPDGSSLGSPHRSPIRSPIHSPTDSPGGILDGQPGREAVLLTDNQAVLYFCLKRINGAVTTLNRIGRECRISEHTLKSCLKKLRQEGLIIYGGRRNCGGRIGFTAKTIERRAVLRGDKNKLLKKLQQINYRALMFTETLEDTAEARGGSQDEDHLMDHPLDHRIDDRVDHPMNHPILCSSSIKKEKELLQGLILEDAFHDLNRRSLLPFLERFDTAEELQDFLDMANACIAAAREGHGRAIQNPYGFLIAQLRMGYINPPEGYKSRRVRAQEARNRQLEEELATLRQLKDRERQLRFELFQARLSEEEVERLEREARQKVNPDIGLSTARQIEVYKDDILRRWFEEYGK